MAIIAVAIIASVFLASTGFMNQDELIYVLMTEAALEGRLTIANGLDETPSPLEQVNFLVAGTDGLVPQYPSGFGFLAAPFYWAAGIRGIIFLNALAFIGLLVATYGLGRRLSLDQNAALTAVVFLAIGTYALEYAPTIWPHALSMLVVVGAVLAVVSGTGRTTPRSWLSTGLGGLIVGIGISVRADVILVVPALVLWMLAQRDLWHHAATFVAATAPGLVFAAWLNYLKFDTWSPLSYGRDSGNLAVATYLPLMVLGAAVVTVTMVLAHPRSRKVLFGRVGLICLLVGASVVGLLPAMRDLVLEGSKGLYVLVIDLQSIDYRQDVAIDTDEGGYLLAYGWLKKALLQSLPYLGLVSVALVCLFRGVRRELFGLVLVVALLWIAPYAWRQWHGGSPLNMRYFLPVLPLLTVLAAAALQELRVAGERPAVRLSGFLCLAVLTLLGLGTVLRMVYEGDALGYALVLYTPLALAGVLFVGGIMALEGPFRLRAGSARVTTAVAIVAMTWAGVVALGYDAIYHHGRRVINEQRMADAATLEDEILVVTATPLIFHRQFQRSKSTVASLRTGLESEAVQLIEQHLAQGHSVYLHKGERTAPIIEMQALKRYRMKPLERGQLEFTVIHPVGPIP